MRQPLSQAPRPHSQQGLALASVLGIMIALSLLGTLMFRNVGTDITHSGVNARRIRAEFAAESAIQWGLVEVSRTGVLSIQRGKDKAG